MNDRECGGFDEAALISTLNDSVDNGGGGAFVVGFGAGRDRRF